ncbi:tetratricopeptide repeat protein [Streptomyces sp. NPDC017979]|uniref:tetratricopeptide repeat protein n=1 Tax=Streptomyces sp. NPDC017979 TaxID=3365024 RepID=UPI0037B23658
MARCQGGGRGHGATGAGGGAHPRTLDALKDGRIAAERAGKAGRPDEAARRYRRLVAATTPLLGPDHPRVLHLRHQLAHWTGESGQPDTAIAMLTDLADDQERRQELQNCSAGSRTSPRPATCSRSAPSSPG